LFGFSHVPYNRTKKRRGEKKGGERGKKKRGEEKRNPWVHRCGGRVGESHPGSWTYKPRFGGGEYSKRRWVRTGKEVNGPGGWEKRRRGE